MNHVALPPTTSHLIRVDESCGVVTKIFRSRKRREPEREWTALTLLAESAAGLSPEPVRADLNADPPVIEMSWLPGTALGRAPVTDVHSAALAEALSRLWRAVPASKIMNSFEPTLNSSAFLAQVRAMLAARPPVQASDVADKALRAGALWLAKSRLGRPAGADVVLGHGDPNLDNYLWDGTGIRIVDFEDSGPSHRAFELAILAEHRSAWAESDLDGAAFATRFDLTSDEVIAFREYRRLAAVFWLIKVRSANSATRRYSADAVSRQAHRLLTLLG